MCFSSWGRGGVQLANLIIRCDTEFCTNSSDRYSGARILIESHIMVAGSLKIVSEIVGHPCLLFRPAAET